MRGAHFCHLTLKAMTCRSSPPHGAAPTTRTTRLARPAATPNTLGSSHSEIYVYIIYHIDTMFGVRAERCEIPSGRASESLSASHCLLSVRSATVTVTLGCETDLRADGEPELWVCVLYCIYALLLVVSHGYTDEHNAGYVFFTSCRRR